MNKNLSSVIEGYSRILVLTGAGISTAAGIADFRGPDGLWTRDPEAELCSTLSHFVTDPDIRAQAWQRRLNSGVWEAEPTKAHLAIAQLEQQGRVVAVVTQNTDGLHQLAGSRQVLEVHGSCRTSHCEGCGRHLPTEAVLHRLRGGEVDPRCQYCGDIIRADSILFGENLVPEVIDAAVAAAESCDLVLAIGTTLAVQPVAGLFPLALSNGAQGVIVNQGETSYDHLATTIDADIEQVVPLLVGS